MKNKFLRGVIGWGVSIALILLIGASTVVAQQKVTLRVAHAWPAERLPAQVEFDKWFMKKYPNIIVKRENYPWADYKQKIMTMAASGTLPDVFYMQDSWSQFWIFYGMTRSIEPFIKNDPEFKRELFYSGSLAPFIWKGELHGLPYDWNTVGTLAYNVDMFDKAGLPYPDENWTFKGEFLETAKKLTKDTNGDGKIDQWGYVDNNWWGYSSAHAHLLPFGGTFVEVYPDKSPAPKETLITKPESIEALQWWADLILKYKVSPTLAQQEAMVNPWYSGKIGMTVGYSWCYEWTKYTPFKWDIAHQPKGPNGRFVEACGSGYAISKTTKHIKEAWTYFREYLSLEGVKKLLLTFGVPARKAGWKAFAERPDLPKHYASVFHKSYEYSIVSPTRVPPKAWQILSDEVQLVLLGKKTAAEAAKTIKEKVDPILAENPLLKAQ